MIGFLGRIPGARILNSLPGDGRELDAVIARHVFHYQLSPDELSYYLPGQDAPQGFRSPVWLPIPPYSTEGGSAWEVLERIDRRRLPGFVRIERELDGYFIMSLQPTDDPLSKVVVARGRTEPLAICRGSLVLLSA